MKFKFDFGKLKLALVIIIAILALAAVIINSLYLAGVGILSTAIPAVAGTSIACSILILVFIALIYFNSYYKIEDKILKFCLGFLTEKISIDTITDIRRDAKKNEIFLIFSNSNTNGQNSVKIMIKKQETDKFIEELRKTNPQIILSVFNDETPQE